VHLGGWSLLAKNLDQARNRRVCRIARHAAGNDQEQEIEGAGHQTDPIDQFKKPGGRKLRRGRIASADKREDDQCRNEE
jgi:hypothetical protein